MFKFERDLAKQIKQLMDQLQETQARVAAFAGEHPEGGRGRAGTRRPAGPDRGQSARPLARSETPNVPGVPSAGALPAVGNSVAEGLTHPFTGATRPFVFDHNLAKGREDVVLVHLNHRLVQMSLRLLRAEVWSREGRKRLHRITARIVPDNVLQHPAVIAHARLVVIGGDRHRLHEEIITAGGLLREGRFVRFGSLREMQEALAAATDEEPSAAVQKKLLALWPKNRRSRCGRPSKPG